MKDLLPPESMPLLNEAHIATLVELGDDNPKAFLQDFLETYTQNWPDIKNDLEEACKNKDINKTRSSIHLLNGSSANMGLERIHTLCGNIEEAIDQNTFSSYEECPLTIEEEYNKSVEALQRYINDL